TKSRACSRPPGRSYCGCSPDRARRHVSTYLLTVQPADFQQGRLTPELRLSDFGDNPALGRIAAGSPLELVRPDGTRIRAWVVDLSTEDIWVFARGGDETVYEGMDNPLFRIRVSPPLTDWDAPPGTEIYQVGESIAD